MNNKVNPINYKLANACQKNGSACCKLGQLFMTTDEHAAIVKWLSINSPEELGVFKARARRLEGFFLYDQGNRCQFLDEQELCRLHADKVKPAECFWWPLHVYRNPISAALEIRISTSCCEGHSCVRISDGIVDDIRNECKIIGTEVIHRFRDEYKGSYDNKFIALLNSSEVNSH